jgi:hypothetical protein
MASIINSTTTAGVTVTGDNSGSLQLATNNGTTAVTIDTSQRVAFVAGTAALPAITTTGDTDTGIYFPSANIIGFTKGGTEAMRIVQGGDAAGKGVLLINGTDQSQSPMVQITGSAADYNLLTIKQTLTSYSTGARLVMFLNSSDAIAGVISHSGVTSVTYGTSSDQRLKSNIADASPVLNKLMTVKVRQFDWTEGNLHQDAGFIAQELAPILSGIVPEGRTEDDWWQLDYAKLTPYLVKSIQEQQALITQLQADVAALKA